MPRALRRSHERKLLVEPAKSSVIMSAGWKFMTVSSADLGRSHCTTPMSACWHHIGSSVRAAGDVRIVPPCSGNFKPWSKDELQTMKEAGDREASKLEQKTKAKPSASSSKAWLSCLPSRPSLHIFIHITLQGFASIVVCPSTVMKKQYGLKLPCCAALGYDLPPFSCV